MKKTMPAIAVIVMVMVAMVIIVTAVYHHKTPHVNVNEIQFDHANRTYKVNQDISVWTQIGVTTKNTMAHVSATLTVYTEDGEQIYKDEALRFSKSFTPPAGWKRRFTTITGGFSITFKIEKSGRYEVHITASDLKIKKQDTAITKFTVE